MFFSFCEGMSVFLLCGCYVNMSDAMLVLFCLLHRMCCTFMSVYSVYPVNVPAKYYIRIPTECKSTVSCLVSLSRLQATLLKMSSEKAASKDQPQNNSSSHVPHCGFGKILTRQSI